MLIAAGMVYTGVRLWRRLVVQVTHDVCFTSLSSAASLLCGYSFAVHWSRASISRNVLLCRGVCTVQEKQYHAWLERSREAPARGLPFKPTMFTIQPGSAIDAQRLLVRGLAHTTQLATLFDPRLPREVGVTACTRMQS